jgi:hypothetical protein
MTEVSYRNRDVFIHILMYACSSQLLVTNLHLAVKNVQTAISKYDFMLTVSVMRCTVVGTKPCLPPTSLVYAKSTNACAVKKRDFNCIGTETACYKVYS